MPPVIMSFKFKSNCLNFSFVSFCLLFFQVSFAQVQYPKLDEIVTGKQKVLGADVITTVATKDTVVYQKAANRIFSPRTQAPIGHASQWLTAALILKLVDEGTLSLDDKVSQYLPVFEKYGKNYITLRHCLSHFTGIQADGLKALKLLQKKKFATLEEEVASYAAREIQTNPGTEFRYTNIGPAIAARVAEVVTKKRFDLLIQQKLFRPLGMRQTTFSTLDASPVDAAGGARSTANDYILFLRMLLNGGQMRGVQILSAESVQQLRTIQTTKGALHNRPAQTKDFQYALGAWVPEGNSTTLATTLTGPSFGGTLPIVDFCRGYAYLLMIKAETEDAAAHVYTEVKDVLDKAYPNGCK